MGLLDVLNGMQNGPRGPKEPAPDGTSSGGMSPITMAIIGLLAYKAIKHLTAGGQPQTAPAGNAPQRLPDATRTTTAQANVPGKTAMPAGPLDAGTPTMPGRSGGADAGLPGGLGDLLKGGLGGLLAGGAAGSVLTGGLNDLLKQFQQAGHGETANSWVGKGENKQIDANDLSAILDSDQLKTLMEQTGLSQNELLSGLSRELPNVINQLTPHGRVPTEDELSNWRA